MVIVRFATPFVRKPAPLHRRLGGLALAASLALGVFAPASALAYVDANANKIDDIIEQVNAGGWNIAFENADPVNGRMRIGVSNPLNILYAVYLGYDHHPTAVDEAAVLAAGGTMAWPFVNIDFIETHATFPQIQLMANLPGVTMVEAIEVHYALNHYGSRIVRARESKGLTKAENYALFPSARNQFGVDGTGVVIGVLDTGVNDETDTINPGYPGHESLKGKFLGGGEFWCGQAACSTPVTGSANPQDHGGAASSLHATHVAGSAMGTGGPSGFFAGVAPGARLVDCKVLSDAGATVGGTNRGLDWCISNRNTLWAGLPAGSIWQGIDVLNLSLGSTECATGTGTSTGATSTLVNTAVATGMVLAIATGNDDAIDCISSPAAGDNCIAVGASQHLRTLDRTDDQVTTFSNEGPRDDDGDADHFDEYKPSVVAPGAGIISAYGESTTDGSAYQQLSGTSMAAPHVAGCVALILEAFPSLTPMQIRTIIQNTAEHNIPTAKVSGDRGQDPYGIDINYDPSCGYGLIDVYAAMKEAQNSTSGVQVVRIGAKADVPNTRVDVTWITQREYPFLGFDLYRAPDNNGSPGTFTKLNTLPIPPSVNGDPVIFNDDNRTPYLYQDTDPALTLGQTYWYRVDWIDLGSVAHAEPPVPADYGQLARVATVFYSIAHNAPDNDLEVRVGADLDYDPGSLGQATFEVLGLGESQQDSAVVLLGATVPANTGTSTLGTIDHFWSMGFNQGDGAEPFLPPSQATPWFLGVKDGGFVNRTGRATSFSLFVNDTPGSQSGSTYITDHIPMPQLLIEGGATPVTLWIPEPQATAVQVAMFSASNTPGAVRLEMRLATGDDGYSATVYRGVENGFETRSQLTAEPLAFRSGALVYMDDTAEPGVTYSYWVQVHEPDGTSFMNGPLSGRVESRGSITLARPATPNPVRGSTLFEYAIGSDIALAGAVPVTLQLLDLQGRVTRTLHRGDQSAGKYKVTWNLRDDHGARVTPGVYFLRFHAGPVNQQQKVMVVR
jgi:hypothetical protein